MANEVDCRHRVIFLSQSFNYCCHMAKSLKAHLPKTCFTILEDLESCLEELRSQTVDAIIVDHRFHGHFSEALDAGCRLREEVPGMPLAMAISNVKQDRKEAFLSIKQFANVCIEKLQVNREDSIEQTANLLSFLFKEVKPRPKIADFFVSQGVITARQKAEVINLQNYYNQPFAIALSMGVITHEELINDWHEFGRSPKLFLYYLERTNRLTNAFLSAYRKCHLRFGDFLVDVLNWVDRERVEEVAKAYRQWTHDQAGVEATSTRQDSPYSGLGEQDLIAAIRQGKGKTVEDLLINTHLGREPAHHWDILMAACQTRDRDMLQMLEIYRRIVSASLDPRGRSCIFVSINEFPVLLDDLIMLGAPAHVKDVNGDYPLLAAVRENRPMIVAKLLCHVQDRLETEDWLQIVAMAEKNKRHGLGGNIFETIVSHADLGQLLVSALERQDFGIARTILGASIRLADNDGAWQKALQLATEIYQQNEDKRFLDLLYHYAQNPKLWVSQYGSRSGRVK